jgi:hypothetical protein
MNFVIPILQTLNGLDREVLLFLLAMACIALAAFSTFVLHRGIQRKK